jgi:hypothetical protein
MRSIHWLFVISAALFVSGIGFVIASARTAKAAPVEATPVAISVTPVASIRQIMQGIVAPAATVVFDSVGTTISLTGTEEKRPTTDEEWTAVGNSAAALVESGNLLMLGSRAVDRGDWIKMSQALVDAGTVALRATETKNVEALFGSGEAINASCDKCHQRYQRQ